MTDEARVGEPGRRARDHARDLADARALGLAAVGVLAFGVVLSSFVPNPGVVDPVVAVVAVATLRVTFRARRRARRGAP